MPMSSRSRSFIALVVVLGLAAVGAAVLHEHVHRPAGLALLAAAAIVAELLEVRFRENAIDGSDSHAFSFSSSVHLAAIMIVGPWQAVLVAAVGVLVADCIRGAALIRVAFNTATFSLATLSAGAVYELLGANPGRLALPWDLVPIAAMVLCYVAVNRVLVAAVVSLTSRMSLRQLLVDALRSELPSVAGEASLGVVIAFFVLSNPWEIVVIGPLVLAVFLSHARLAMLKEETTRALEALASVVDERDPTTFRHSERVAEHVERLGETLALPPADVARLRWAGRLHDLGKFAVDAAVLGKQGRLTPDEWEAMRRHPRLSARLLLRFRFASAAARAVEYHHERYDGEGYYGIERSEIPLAAHFLIVADSYDAMVSDRPYRRGFSQEQALAEIERGAGTQFHPVVAKAFVALQRGDEPLDVLDRSERAELKSLSLRRPRRPPRANRMPAVRPETLAIPALAAAVAAAGLGHAVVAAACAVAAAAALALARRRETLRRRLHAALEDVLCESRAPEDRLRAYVDRVAGASEVRWAALVGWEEAILTGTVESEFALAHDGPNVAALTSWLAREGASREALLVGAGAEVGCDGTCLAAPVRADGRTEGYLVFLFAGAPAHHVELAIADSGSRLAALRVSAQPAPRLAALAGSAR
jgi:HD domain-containing protein